MTKVFVVSTPAVTDCENELMADGEVVAAFSTLAAAYEYINNVEETYFHKRCDYTVTEVELDG